MSREEEFAAMRRTATEKMIAQLAPGPRGPDIWWLENLDLTKRSQPWRIIDPPDGKIPPLTADAKQRRAGPARSSFFGGPFDSPKDFGPLERCISRGLPSSMIPRLKLTERYRRIAAHKIAWSVTMDEPTTWTAPWTIAMALTSEPQQSLPFECHEGNLGLRNILSAARAAEKQWDQGRRGSR